MKLANKLLNIHNIHNWSWQLDSHKPVVPPIVLNDKSAVDGVASLTLDAATKESDEEEFLPEEVEGESQAAAALQRRRERGKITCSY